MCLDIVDCRVGVSVVFPDMPVKVSGFIDRRPTMPRRREEHGGLKRKDAEKYHPNDHEELREYNYDWPINWVQTPVAFRGIGGYASEYCYSYCNLAYFRSAFHDMEVGTGAGQFTGMDFAVRRIQFRFAIHGQKTTEATCGAGYNVPIRITIVKEPVPSPGYYDHGKFDLVSHLFRLRTKSCYSLVTPNPIRDGASSFVAHVNRRFEILYDEVLPMPMSGVAYSVNGSEETNFFSSEGTLHHVVDLDFPEWLLCRTDVTPSEATVNPHFSTTDIDPVNPTLEYYASVSDPQVGVWNRMTKNQIWAIVTPLCMGYHDYDNDSAFSGYWCQSPPDPFVRDVLTVPIQKSGYFRFFHESSSKVWYQSS